jgi:hypothetical protein
MRESSDGRRTVPLGSDAYAVGETVVSVVDGERGTVTAISTVVAPLVNVRWQNAMGDVIYPMDATAIRKAWPWE